MFLSKTDYLKGMDCVKGLWLFKNRKDLVPPTDEALQRRFDIGNAVQEIARKRYPTGILVQSENHNVFEDALRTQ